MRTVAFSFPRGSNGEVSASATSTCEDSTSWEAEVTIHLLASAADILPVRLSE